MTISYFFSSIKVQDVLQGLAPSFLLPNKACKQVIPSAHVCPLQPLPLPGPSPPFRFTTDKSINLKINLYKSKDR